MALFTDAAVVTVEDLLVYESSLAQVAAVHGIDVESKIGLARSAAGDKLLLWLLNCGASDPQWLNRRIIGVSTVVVTPPLKRWLIFESLSRVFAEAYEVQLNLRYQGKWSEYQTESKSAAESFFQAGAGIVYSPLPRPEAPLVSLQSGNAPAQTVFIQTAWVDAAGDESALSLANATALPDNSSLVVAMAEGVLQAPVPAAGWNLYANSQATGLTRQNTYPLGIGSTWQLPASGLEAGAAPVDGQRPAFYIALSKQIRRG